MRALKILNAEKENSFSVVFCGSDKGNLSYVKEQVALMGLEDVVHFLDFVPIEQLIGLYQNAFALVYPSYFGPNNLPPLEAFALRCSVICADAPGMKQQLGDGALYFDPKDPQGIVSKIEEFQQNQSLKNCLIKNGYERAHSWTCKEYLGAVNSILDEFSSIRSCWSTKETYVHT